MRAEQLRRLAQERWTLAQMVPPNARASLLEIGHVWQRLADERGRATNVQQHHDSRQTRNIFLVPRAPFCERARRGIFTPEGSMWKAIVAGSRIGAIAAVVIVGAFIVTVLVAELAWMLKP